MARRSSCRPWLQLQLVGARPDHACRRSRLSASCPIERREACWRDALVHSEPAGTLAIALLVMLLESLLDRVRTVQQELIDQVEAPFSDRGFGVLPVESEDDADDLPAVR